MSLTFGTVHFTQQPDKVIFASNELLRKLKLVGTRAIQLKLGQKSIRTFIKPLKKKGKHLYLPASIRSLVGVPKQGTILISSRKPSEIQLGPLIGILTSATYRSPQAPFGTKSLLIKQFLKAGTKKAFYFAFTMKDIDWQQETVDGYFINDNGAWMKKTVPFPDVIYNRLTNRRAETTGALDDFKDRFVKRNIPIFNWSFFNKWDVYKLLNGEPEDKYVPESYIDPSPEKIEELLEKHQFVYLKPTGGSLGYGIYRLTYHPQRGYFARYRHNGKNVLLRFSRFQSLMRMLNSRRGRMRNYVVQQGIRLIEIDGCPIDFRFHMNKNAENKWVVSGIGAKKAGKGSVTTHVKNGGQLMTPEQALDIVFGSAKAEEILEEMKKVAIKLAEAIERNYPHLLGELGFDLGIDKDENIWMFEANSKPGRTIFKHPALKAQGNSSLSHIFEYGLYLSKFRRRDA